MSAAFSDLKPTSEPRIQSILVVDDDVLIRLAIAGYLRECGFVVLEADGAAEAVTILEAAVEVDLVFSDVQMPGDMDGFALSRWVRAHRPDIKIILASGVARASTIAADLCKHDAFVEKPYHEQQVVERIRALLATRRQPGDA